MSYFIIGTVEQQRACEESRALIKRHGMKPRGVKQGVVNESMEERNTAEELVKPQGTPERKNLLGPEGVEKFKVKALLY